MRDVEKKSEPQLAAVLPESQREINTQLYYMLVMLTTDDAHRMMSDVEQGNGAEARRSLCWECEPDVRVRQGQLHTHYTAASSGRT